MSSCLTRGRIREAERKQAHDLADLDRQKILFFQNISHELRSMFTVTCIFVYYVNDVFDIIFRMSYQRTLIYNYQIILSRSVDFNAFTFGRGN